MTHKLTHNSKEAFCWYSTWCDCTKTVKLTFFKQFWYFHTTVVRYRCYRCNLFKKKWKIIDVSKIVFPPVVSCLRVHGTIEGENTLNEKHNIFTHNKLFKYFYIFTQFLKFLCWFSLQWSLVCCVFQLTENVWPNTIFMSYHFLTM